jgi:plasmid maintenance system antidote protein VapI
MEKRGRSETPLSRYCLVRDNRRLRDVLNFKIEESGKEKKQIAKELGIGQGNLISFLKHGTKSISQYNVLRICDYFDLELEVVIRKKDDV